MAEANEKQEILATKGTFEFRGIISNFDKNQETETKTKKGNTMRTLTFTIDTAEGHSHRLQIRAYESEKVYFSKTELDKDGNRKNDIKEVKWADRLKFNLEGYQPIDRLSYHYGKTTDDKGNEKRTTVNSIKFDAIPKILEDFNVGDSVHIFGNIEIQDYTMQNGNTGTAVKLEPTRIYHLSEDINFNDEKFTEMANFTQKFLVDEVETTGSNEMIITGLVIGNRQIGRQDFMLKDKEYSELSPLFQSFKSVPKYVSIKVYGVLLNGAVKENKNETEYVEFNGIKIPVKQNPMERNTLNSFVREFAIKGVATDSNQTPIIEMGDYTEENVQEFINKFIRGKKEFGASSDSVTETTEATTEDTFDF